MEIEKYSPKWLLNEIRNAKSDAHALFKIIEFQKALTEQCNIAGVSISLERAKKYARHQHFLGTEGKDLVEFEDWKAKD